MNDWYIKLDNLSDKKVLKIWSLVQRARMCRYQTEDCFGSYNGRLDFWWGNGFLEDFEEITSFKEVKARIRAHRHG